MFSIGKYYESVYGVFLCGIVAVTSSLVKPTIQGFQLPACLVADLAGEARVAGSNLSALFNPHTNARV